jgi:hypothetical protein
MRICCCFESCCVLLDREEPDLFTKCGSHHKMKGNGYADDCETMIIKIIVEYLS